MHIILKILSFVLWLPFCFFRHVIFLPSAFGGVFLIAWLVFGNPVIDLNDTLQKETTAWRTAPPRHYMWKECPARLMRFRLRKSRQPAPSLQSPQKPL